MIDPIGSLERIREFWLSYLDTAFRISDPDLAEARRRLLRSPGALTTELFLEPVARYREAEHALEARAPSSTARNRSARLTVSGAWLALRSDAGGAVSRIFRNAKLALSTEGWPGSKPRA